eukprot:gene9184-10158_t
MSLNDKESLAVCNNENEITEEVFTKTEDAESTGESKELDVQETAIAANSEEVGEVCEDVEMHEDDESDKSGTPGPSEMVDFKIVWNKQTFPITFDLYKTIEELKDQIKELTGIPGNMQKLMYKGLIKDHSVTLRDAKITKGIKLMVVGSTLKDVLTVTPPSKDKVDAKVSDSVTTAKEPLSSQKMHKKILEKGMPDDVMPGIKGTKERLPAHPLSGMLNKRAGKVRLTFKLELDQLWLGTKDRTEKLPMTSIRNVISEAIEGHEQYHILALQLGPTEASRYWIYWVPAQYVDAIKDAVLGRWQAF